MEGVVGADSPSYEPRWIVIATCPPGSSPANSSPGSASSGELRVEARRAHRDADLDVDLLGTELVVAAERRPRRLDAEVGEAMRDVRQVLVEQRGEVHRFHRLGHADGGGRLRGELADLGIDHRWRPHTLGVDTIIAEGSGIDRARRAIAIRARTDGPRRGGQRRPPGPRSRRRRGRGLPRAGPPCASAAARRDRGARAARDGRGARLRQPVRPAHRAARARAERLLRAPAARHADRRARAPRRAGRDPVGRAVIGL